MNLYTKDAVCMAMSMGAGESNLAAYKTIVKMKNIFSLFCNSSANGFRFGKIEVVYF